MTQNQSQSSTFRILDAAINRAAEGLRVVEDYLRMSLDDKNLSSRAKHLRHQLTTTTSDLDKELLVAARDAQRDVGRTNQTDEEYIRDSDSGLVQSNMARVKQSLRTIEEYGKTISAGLAKSVEQLRYEAYTLEKAIMTTMLSIRSLADVRVCVLLDRRKDMDSFLTIAKQLIDSNVGMIQLRDKSLTDRQLISYGKALTELTKNTNSQWIMNDRADLALAAGANGVHLGQDDLSVFDARRIVGAAKLVGVSTHSIEQARQAVIDGANYIGVGPVFESQTKSFDSLVGLDLLRSVASEIQLPAFAIGGINQKNVENICNSGIRRIALQNCILQSDDPGGVAKSFRDLLNETSNESPSAT